MPLHFEVEGPSASALLDKKKNEPQALIFWQGTSINTNQIP
jgi:hypothetical protein